MATEVKAFAIRLPMAEWKFLRKYAFDNETTMNALILEMVEKLKKKNEKV